MQKKICRAEILKIQHFCTVTFFQACRNVEISTFLHCNFFSKRAEMLKMENGNENEHDFEFICTLLRAYNEKCLILKSVKCNSLIHKNTFMPRKCLFTSQSHKLHVAIISSNSRKLTFLYSYSPTHPCS